jgi:hypothetical protein
MKIEKAVLICGAGILSLLSTMSSFATEVKTDYKDASKTASFGAVRVVIPGESNRQSDCPGDGRA